MPEYPLLFVGPNGTQGKVQMRMNKEEIALLKKSADALKEVIAQIELLKVIVPRYYSAKQTDVNGRNSNFSP